MRHGNDYRNRVLLILGVFLLIIFLLIYGWGNPN